MHGHHMCLSATTTPLLQTILPRNHCWSQQGRIWRHSRPRERVQGSEGVITSYEPYIRLSRERDRMRHHTQNGVQSVQCWHNRAQIHPTMIDATFIQFFWAGELILPQTHAAINDLGFQLIITLPPKYWALCRRNTSQGFDCFLF
jgi:hypothetical protein